MVSSTKLSKNAFNPEELSMRDDWSLSLTREDCLRSMAEISRLEIPFLGLTGLTGFCAI